MLLFHRVSLLAAAVKDRDNIAAIGTGHGAEVLLETKHLVLVVFVGDRPAQIVLDSVACVVAEEERVLSFGLPFVQYFLYFLHVVLPCFLVWVSHLNDLVVLVANALEACDNVLGVVMAGFKVCNHVPFWELSPLSVVCGADHQGDHVVEFEDFLVVVSFYHRLCLLV